MAIQRSVIGIKLQTLSPLFSEILFYLIIVLWTFTDAVTLTGSSEYAVPGTEFTLTCDTPEETSLVRFYRRPDVTLIGSIRLGGGQFYNTRANPVVPCTADVCSCVTSGRILDVNRTYVNTTIPGSRKT